MKSFRFVFSLAGAFAALALTRIFAEQTPPTPATSPAEPVVETSAPAAPVAPTPAAAPDVERPAVHEKRARDNDWRRSNRDRVIFKWGHEAVLEEGDDAEHVVALFGSVRADGKLYGNAVAVCGPVFLGSTGSARGNVVAVLGNVRVDGPVDGNVVSVLGGVELGPKARVRGNVVSIGAPIHVDPQAVVEDGVVEVGAIDGLFELKGLQAWVRHALLLGRPLALHHDLGWAWGVAALFLGFYLFVALVMNGALVKCSETLEQRPGKTVLAAFLTVLLTPLLFVVLSVTVIGAPALMVAMTIVALIGKAAFLCWFGRRITLALGLRHALPAVFVGGLMITAVYLVPFVGFAMLKLTDMLGVGMVVYTMMLTGRREKPVTAKPIASGSSAAATTASAGASAASAVPTQSMGFTRSTPPPPPPVPAMVASEPVSSGEVAFTAMLPPMPAPTPAMSQEQTQSSAVPRSATSSIPPIPVTSALPRAGFGIRLGALLIDSLIFAFALFTGGGPDVAIACMAIYLVVLWGLKGTTIGGIICGLKIVRLDDRPLDWTTALVRGLAGFLSVFPAGLGFLWVAFDEEKQSWHDKVAGTVVVYAPKGMSLV
jgi:uncharacterized RDD family membrane protein YckC/cytoskeletal protein CcmA (bactofilin family)